MEERLAEVDLILEVVAALAGRFEFLRGRSLLRVPKGLFLDLAPEQFYIAVPDAVARQTLVQSVVDHLRQTPEFSLDGLGLPDQHFEHPVLDALGQHEVMAVHLGSRLELAIDASVALLDAARVPRQVEMEHVRAASLQVETLPGRVGSDEDSQRLYGRVSVEAALHVPPAFRAGQAVDDGDPLFCSVATR